MMSTDTGAMAVAVVLMLATGAAVLLLALVRRHRFNRPAERI
jgi:hypothetical protein